MNTSHCIRLILMLMILTALSPLTGSQRNLQPTDSLMILKELPDITVSGILNTKLNLPVQTVTAAEIDVRALLSPGDVLHQVPGVMLTRDGAWATSVNLRGFPESKLLFLSDGDRMQTASDIAGSLSTIDLSSVDRIEIVKEIGRAHV